MGTLASMNARIIAELGRSDTSMSDIVTAQILSSIEHYQTTRFWFNEVQATLTTSSSLAYYAWPADMLELDSMNITVNSRKYILKPMTYQQMDWLDLNQVFGYPDWYSTYAQQFRLYPVPNATFTIVLSYQKKFTTLSAGADSNVWTNEAERLIRIKTEKDLLALRYHDFDAAMALDVAERQALDQLLLQSDKLLGSGSLQGSGW